MLVFDGVFVVGVVVGVVGVGGGVGVGVGVVVVVACRCALVCDFFWAVGDVVGAGC